MRWPWTKAKAVENEKGLRRISIVNFTGNRRNWGCQATSCELLQFLSSAFEDMSPQDVSLIPLIPRHRVDKDLEETELDPIYDAMHSVCSGERVSAAVTYLERLCRQRYGSFADEVSHSDFVFFQAEGTMAGTDFVRGARLLLLPFVAKHAWNKPVYSLNQTIFSCCERFTKAMAEAFNSLDFVAVRENISLNAAIEAGINPVHHIPDMAFLTTPERDDRLPNLTGDRYFAVTGSAFVSSEIHEQIFSAADRIRNETGLVPLIALSTVADNMIEQLANENWKDSEYVVVPPDVSYRAAAAILQQCRFLLGGRYHMSIMAAAMGTPSVQIRGNTYKNEGLSAMLGGIAPVRDPEDIEAIVRDAVVLAETPAGAHAGLHAAVVPIKQSLYDARNWFARHLGGEDAATPAAFSHAPGVTISASEHLEPYRAQAIEQAKTFSFSNGDRMGLGLQGRSMVK